MMRFFRELFRFGTPETEGERIFHRIMECCLVVFSLIHMLKWASYIPQLDNVVLPLGIAHYVDIRFMFNEWMPYANVGVIALFFLLGFFRVWRFSYLMVVISFHFQYAARYSQGEISHCAHVLGMALLALALAAIFFQRGETFRKFSFGMMVFYVGLSYLSAGVCKLIATGITWVDGKHLWLWVGERSTDVMSQFGSFEPNMLQTALLDNYYLATLILIFGIGSELAGALFWFRKFRPWVGILLIGMHYGILFSMNIDFDKYVYVVALLAFPWARWLDAFLEKRDTAFISRIPSRLLPE